MDQTTTSFFYSLFGKLDSNHFISLWTLPGRKSVHVPCPEYDHAAALAIGLKDEGYDVYFGVCPRSSDLGPHKRGDRSSISALPAFWVDIDMATGVHAAKNLPPDVEAAATLISEADLPDPTTLVHSGGGVHAYWILDAPQIITSPADAQRVEQVEVALTMKVFKAAQARGWAFDRQCADITRVLRVPGTLNYKAMRAAAKVNA